MSVSVTVDVDGVAGLACRPGGPWEGRLTARSEHEYVWRGLERVLEVLERHGARATFYVPGATLLEHPARFAELVTRGRQLLAAGAVEAAAATLREGLGLWRGEAFEEFPQVDACTAEAARLAELRLGAIEERVEADLALGRHRELLAELEGLTREHPLRERLWGQLLLCLYRCGRQAEALVAGGSCLPP